MFEKDQLEDIAQKKKALTLLQRKLRAASLANKTARRAHKTLRRDCVTRVKSLKQQLREIGAALVPAMRSDQAEDMSALADRLMNVVVDLAGAVRKCEQSARGLDRRVPSTGKNQ